MELQEQAASEHQEREAITFYSPMSLNHAPGIAHMVLENTTANVTCTVQNLAENAPGKGFTTTILDMTGNKSEIRPYLSNRTNF